MNSIGQLYRLTSFGESHGPAIGGVIDGFPAGIPVDIEKIQLELDRRRPGQSHLTTQRQEADKVEILSGVFEGLSLGTPIGFIIRNKDSHSAHYDNLRDTYRPSHADFTYQMKYGHRDHRGGGRSSARETASRVVAGAFARQALSMIGVDIYAYTSKIGDVELPADYPVLLERPEQVEESPTRCPHAETAERMTRLIEQMRADGDSAGGTVTCVINNLKAGVGEPVFDKLQALLARAMMSINATKAFEYGMGMKGCANRGSEVIDEFFTDQSGLIGTRSNFSGGIQGGISNGQPIYFNVAFKPVATLMREVNTVNKQGENITLKVNGRHDPCVVPRAVPIVEAMACCTVLDAIMMDNARSEFAI